MEEYSLRSQVFQTIRDDILKGKYEENDELREATLGKELGVSRTTSRIKEHMLLVFLIRMYMIFI